MTSKKCSFYITVCVLFLLTQPGNIMAADHGYNSTILICLSPKTRLVVFTGTVEKSPDIQSETEQKLGWSEGMTPKNIKGVPAVCVSLIHQLARQPFFTGEGSTRALSKFLPIQNSHLVSICKILDDNMEGRGSRGWWTLSEVGGGYNLFFTKDDPIKSGLELGIYTKPDEAITICDFSGLEEVYQKMMSQVSNGWEPSDPKRFTDIFFKPKNTGNFFLLTKKSSLRRELDLTWCLLFILKCSEGIHMDNIWTAKSESDPPFIGPLYFWIPKHAYTKVVNALQLKIPTEKLIW